MWPFTRKPAPPKELSPVAKATSSFFSGPVGQLLALEPEARAERLRELVFKITPGNMKVFKAQGDGTFALDSADDCLSAAKGAYSLARDTLPENTLIWYASQGFLGFQVCAILAQHWLVDRACSTPARDAIRKGYTVTSLSGDELDPDTLKRIARADKRYGVRKQCTEFVKMARVFGIRIAMFKVDSKDPNYYQNPFNIDGVTPGSYKGIVQIDPYWCSPELSMDGAADPMSPMFYQPTWWLINGKRIHHTHLVIMTGPEVSDILKPSYLYAGLSIPQMIYERVYAAERTANEAPMLAMTKRSTLFYTDLDKALASEGKFLEKIAEWAGFRDNYAVKVAGEGDKIEEHDTSLTDLDQVIMTQYQICAAIAQMPVTKLMGTSVKGMNATGEYDEATYHESLESIQSNDMEPLINRHHQLLIRSEIAPQAPFDVEITWNPLDTPTAEELANENKIKAETGKILWETGAIDGVDERARITADKQSGYTGLPDVVSLDPVPEMVSMDASLFDTATGEYAGAILITNQTFIDDAIVAAKIVDKDFHVQLSPEFVTSAGKRYRVILDGHHSLAAALRSGNEPCFEQADYSGSDYVNAVTSASAFAPYGG